VCVIRCVSGIDEDVRDAEVNMSHGNSWESDRVSVLAWVSRMFVDVRAVQNEK